MSSPGGSARSTTQKLDTALGTPPAIGRLDDERTVHVGKIFEAQDSDFSIGKRKQSLGVRAHHAQPRRGNEDPVLRGRSHLFARGAERPFIELARELGHSVLADHGRCGNSENMGNLRSQLHRFDFAGFPFVAPGVHRPASRREIETFVTELIGDVNESERRAHDDDGHTGLRRRAANLAQRREIESRRRGALRIVNRGGEA